MKLSQHFYKFGKRLARVSFLFFVLTAAFHLRREDYKSQEFKVYPNPMVKYFALGYQQTMADAIWIKALLNLDYCETKINPTYNAGQNINDILSNTLQPSRCNKGWLYQWIHLTTELDQRFLSIYVKGGTALSILVDDREGARIIFDKGLSLFPHHWDLNYRAAYHYLYEIQDAEKAAKLMMISYKNGGPDFLPALAAQLFTRLGQAAFAKTFLEEFIQENPDSINLNQILKRLKEINEALK